MLSLKTCYMSSKAPLTFNRFNVPLVLSAVWARAVTVRAFTLTLALTERMRECAQQHSSMQTTVHCVIHCIACFVRNINIVLYSGSCFSICLRLHRCFRNMRHSRILSKARGGTAFPNFGVLVFGSPCTRIKCNICFFRTVFSTDCGLSSAFASIVTCCSRPGL